jgi:hypothetical protein
MPERHRFPWWDDHDDPANAGERHLKEPLTTGELHALIGACLTHGCRASATGPCSPAPGSGCPRRWRPHPAT